VTAARRPPLRRHAQPQRSLEGLLKDWQSGPPDVALAARLLDQAEQALGGGTPLPADLWHRWLDTTRRRPFLRSLPDRAQRHRWPTWPSRP